MDAAEGADGLRLTELVAAISLATDLGTGQPLTHALRTCLLSSALAAQLGLDAATAADVHYTALLRFLGCTADTPETARLAGGDQTALLAAAAPAFMGSTGELIRVLVRAVGAGEPLGRRARLLGEALSEPDGLVAHCEVGARLAARIGLGEGVVHALDHAYERWDGRGPRRVRGAEIPVAVRVVVVARDAVLWQRLAGPAAALDVLTARRGRAYDPGVVDAMRTVGLPGDEPEQPWEQVLAAEPEPVRRVGPVGVDRALDAVGDFADLRSTWTRGRSRRVAGIAAAAGRGCGLPAARVEVLRRAALVADVGAVGVPAGLWARPGPLGVADTERLRLHPYLSERVLGRCRGLGAVARLAGAHHERLDGSGYHRGASRAALSRDARVLAAADVWTALGEARAHRPARTPAQAREILWSEVACGRLDPVAVEVVLAAAGEAGGRRPAAARPAGLSEREIEVLRLVARGASNRAVARLLSLSAKTVGHHVAHIYNKIGVTTRPAAALFAMEHDLLDE